MRPDQMTTVAIKRPGDAGRLARDVEHGGSGIREGREEGRRDGGGTARGRSRLAVGRDGKLHVVAAAFLQDGFERIARIIRPVGGEVAGRADLSNAVRRNACDNSVVAGQQFEYAFADIGRLGSHVADSP